MSSFEKLRTSGHKALKEGADLLDEDRIYPRRKAL